MAELPEVETLRRELEKEVGGQADQDRRGHRRQGHRATATRRLPARLEGAKVKSVDRRGPLPRRQPRHRRAARHRPRQSGHLEKVAPKSTAAQGHRRHLHLHPGRPDPLRRPERHREVFVVATDAVAEEVPELAGRRPRPGRRRRVVDVVRPADPGPERQAQGAPHGPDGRGRHRHDLQRRDPVGGRPAPRPDSERAVLPGDPPPLPGPRRDAPRGREAPRHDRRRSTLRRPLRQAGRLPGPAQGLRPGGRALPPLPGPGGQGAVRQQAASTTARPARSEVLRWPCRDH